MNNKKDVEMHQHVTEVRGMLEKFGMSHPLNAVHKNKATQLVHDKTLALEIEYDRKKIENARLIRKKVVHRR